MRCCTTQCGAVQSSASMGDNGGPQKTVVLDVVGLSRSLISQEHTPFLYEYINSKQSSTLCRDVEPAFPALTCPAQSTYLSGTGPTTHGITANVREHGRQSSEQAARNNRKKAEVRACSLRIS